MRRRGVTASSNKGWNVAARALCESEGYEVVRQFPTDAHMRKLLSVGVAPTTG